MADEGFELKPTFCATMNDVTRYLGDDLFRDEVDLILVDWDLGAGLRGETVISEIRCHIAYKDVVFYSANIDILELRRASFAEGHEGVYFVSRNELPEEVNQLFHVMIKKVLDLDHTRGIVMGATSDVDQMARECLQLAHDMLDNAGKAGVLREMIDLLDEKVPNVERAIAKLKGSPAVVDILKAHATFTANDGLRILSRLLDLPAFAIHQGHQASVKRYMADIVPKRNVLGHKVLTPDGKPFGIAGANGQVVALDEMRALRRALLELRNEFRLLHAGLSAR
ncbi:MAG: hypothetical protein IOC82_04325 [Aestuariivirga sp.]|uniref:hypothetical protein n=1 Tax=Aestuariivirga sp. TaxID=2650926 RepID=UPI0025C1CC49|nr:hypothetical protein [Aestuariivirga sp.]MCA3560238.1 hypothetical protein [Aestuariivirga sp.]